MENIQTSIKRKGAHMAKKKPVEAKKGKVLIEADYPIRKQYGRSKLHPPKGLDEKDYMWVDNEHAVNYGWNESDSAFQARIKKTYHIEKTSEKSVKDK